MKRMSVSDIGKLLLLFILFCFTLSCPPPETETPELDYDGIISIHSYKDPYFVTGKPFSLSILLDTDSYTMDEYDFTIFYDTAKLELNTGVDNGISPGLDGFLTEADVSTPGIIFVSGSTNNGIGPGMHLQLLLLHFNPLAGGEAEIFLEVNLLSATDNTPLTNNESVLFTIDINTPAYHSLSGMVLDSIGGAPVESARVELPGTDHVTTTDENGGFSFDHILMGVYEVLVTKEGRAGSKVEQVHVTGNESPVEIIQPHYNYLADAVTPPSIIIRGILSNEEYNGIISIDIEIEQGSCPVISTEFHRSIYLKIGLTPMIFYEAANSSDHHLSYKWNTSLYPTGEVFIKVVAYDSNNNRSEVNIPVTVITACSQGAPGIPPLKEYYYIVANTFGQSMDIIRKYPAFPQMLRDSEYTDRAPTDSTIIIEFSVEKYYHGVALFRSMSEESGYDLVCQTSYVSDSSYRCIDYSPVLTPHTTVYYKLAYYNQYGIGPLTDPISVRILPKYNLSLVSPADNTMVTETSVTLTWTCEPSIEDARRTDWVVASNILDATIVAYSFIIDQTEYTLHDLLYNNTYEWDVRSYYEYINSEGMANVLSRSFPRGKGASDLSLNGAFIFTVIMPEK